ncbi:MAG: phosphoribosylaminoimidazolesuccinocarboxamide synthase [Patescibacteria group bacterium]
MSEDLRPMEKIARGELVSEGKTKKIYAVQGDAKHAIVEYKNTITAFDDPSFTKEFATKAKYSNTTTSRVFEMLNTAGVPTAFVRQLSDTEFLAEKCTMVPLEVVVRRYAVGSYLKRHPEFAKSEGLPWPGLPGQGEPPHRFEKPMVEFFLKTTRGGLKDAQGETIVEGLDPAKGEEDPFIENPHDAQWRLVHPKKQSTDPEASLGRTIDAARVVGGATIPEMGSAIVRALETLELFFTTHAFKLIDFKIEFGVTQDGRVVISDVIDNDSWRLRDKNWNDVSKQSFRDGEKLSKIEDKYELVAAVLEQSRN